MSDPAHEARLVLHEWARAPDPDPYQQEWKGLYLEAMIEAARRTGLLPDDELDTWQEVTDHDSWPTPAHNPGQATAHLQHLLEAITPMTRGVDEPGQASRRHFYNALTTLHKSGVLADPEHSEWRERALAREAPWLEPEDVHAVANLPGAVAISVPADTPEEELEDQAAADQADQIGRGGEVRRVLLPPGLDRHSGGTAITAAVLREASVDVHFHHIGGPRGDTTGFAHLDAFRGVLDQLTAPRLADDLGTRYTPTIERPVSGHGGGGLPDPDLPMVVSGNWHYVPAVPERAEWISVGDAPEALTLSLV